MESECSSSRCRALDLPRPALPLLAHKVLCVPVLRAGQVTAVHLFMNLYGPTLAQISAMSKTSHVATLLQLICKSGSKCTQGM